MGGKLGTLFARAGHEVVFSYSRSKKKLNALGRDAGGNVRAGSPSEAARDADAVLLAAHWSRIDDVLSQAGDLSGKVIVTPRVADLLRDLFCARRSVGDDEPGVAVVHRQRAAPRSARC
jgi:predicted dinucleotide-binding enzyme